MPLAMLAFTGLETVANLAEEARRPGVDLPRSLFAAIATVVTVYVAIAIVALSASPGPVTELGTTGCARRSSASPKRSRRRRPRAARRGDPLLRRRERRADPARVGDDVDLRASPASPTRSASTASCRARSGGSTGARSSRRRRSSASTVISSAIVIASGFITHDVTYLASLFSFGVLLAFTATQLAVIKLRVTEPDLPRPYRTPLNVTIRGAEIPLPAVVGAVLTFAVWIAGDRHPSRRAVRRARPGSLVGHRRLRRRPPLARRGAHRAGDRARHRALRRRAALPAHPRADEDRRSSARRWRRPPSSSRSSTARRRGDVRRPRPARARARRADAARPRRGPRPRSPRRARSGTSTASMSKTVTVRARAIGKRDRRARPRDRRRPDRRSAPRPAGAGSPASSRRPSTTCSVRRRARCSSSRSRSGCSTRSSRPAPGDGLTRASVPADTLTRREGLGRRMRPCRQRRLPAAARCRAGR